MSWVAFSLAPINVVRLTYHNEEATSRVLPSEQLLKLMRNPLLRSTGVLQGLFYEYVIVTEADSDRVFYQEINDRLLKYKPEWKMYPRFRSLPYLNLKSKVVSNEINSQNDWRLDEKRSIEGGILYLNYLNEYWMTPEKTEILSDAFANDIPKTDILLASYNSGAYRVKKSILKNKKDWLFDESLTEARKYVMNIKSYCYSFNKGNSNEK